MSKISGKNTKPEILIRKKVHNLGYRFRLHRKELPGKPDLVFPKYKKVIFINGCFWHGHNKCSRSKLPSTNKKFWSKKIAENKKRDKINYTRLKKNGWSYLIIWQCELVASKDKKIVDKISSFLR